MQLEQQAIKLAAGQHNAIEDFKVEAQRRAARELEAARIAAAEAEEESKQRAREADAAVESLNRALRELGVKVKENRSLEQTVADLLVNTTSLRVQRDELSEAVAAAKAGIARLEMLNGNMVPLVEVQQLRAEAEDARQEAAAESSRLLQELCALRDELCSCEAIVDAASADEAIVGGARPSWGSTPAGARPSLGEAVRSGGGTLATKLESVLRLVKSARLADRERVASLEDGQAKRELASAMELTRLREANAALQARVADLERKCTLVPDTTELVEKIAALERENREMAGRCTALPSRFRSRRPRATYLRAFSCPPLPPTPLPCTAPVHRSRTLHRLGL